MYGFCLTFTANLSKKIHAKNLKIFFKKFLLKKNLFLGYGKRGFFWGEIPRKKCLEFRLQKKRLMTMSPPPPQKNRFLLKLTLYILVQAKPFVVKIIFFSRNQRTLLIWNWKIEKYTTIWQMSSFPNSLRKRYLKF